jgi:hypothetical protein
MWLVSSLFSSFYGWLFGWTDRVLFNDAMLTAADI